MESPPDTERNEQFVALSDMFFKSGVPVPIVHQQDLDRGYFLLEDVGSREFLSEYRQGNINICLDLACEELHTVQSVESFLLPAYGFKKVWDELEIFSEYICDELLKVSSDPLGDVTNQMVDTFLALPQVTVHRDYHCRNLLYRHSADGKHIGIVDFQDAVLGPVTYDLASLLYDCYWQHDPNDIERCIERFWQSAQNNPVNEGLSDKCFREGVKITAVQRLLKAAGIFIRLWLQREQKTHLKYVLPSVNKAAQVSDEVDFLKPLGGWLSHEIVPQLEQQLDFLK